MLRGFVLLVFTGLALTACSTPRAPDDVSLPAPPIDVELDVTVPLERAWQAWTDTTALTSWLARDANVRIEVGGPYELFWEPAHPWWNSTLHCTLTEVVPLKTLAFTWQGPEQYADLMNHGDPPPTHVTVRFERRGAKTHMRLEHAGWGAGRRWYEARNWQEDSWHRAFGNLESFLQVEKTPTPVNPPTH